MPFNPKSLDNLTGKNAGRKPGTKKIQRRATISTIADDAIEQECEQTGETYSQVIERLAIEHLVPTIDPIELII
jgi:hypothetical protein